MTIQYAFPVGLDGKTDSFLGSWLRGHKYRPILSRDGFIGIHDTPDIAHDRTWLFGLTDYRVHGVSGGVIWLMTRGV
jgi:hypothetical protein